MKQFIRAVCRKYFAVELDLRVKLFNVLAICGMAVSLIIGAFGLFNESWRQNALLCVAAAVLGFVLLIYSNRTGRYQLCYMITVTVVFIVIFPLLFFTAGGYHSGMPSFFVFAVIFTVFMLKAKKAVFFAFGELALYTAVCVFAYYHPETVNAFSHEGEVLTDIILGFCAVSLVLGVCILIHIRVYNEQNEKLTKQNALLDDMSHAKTEFLSSVSHEMRTPLTVISVNVQTIIDSLDDMGEIPKNNEIKELLVNSHNEIMRLSRMVGGMLTLASLSEKNGESEVDLSILLNNIAEVFKLNLQKRGNSLSTEIETGLKVWVNADLMTQVVVNLLQNAATHTENGVIALSALRNMNRVTVAVRDTGEGIPPNLLSSVYGRGITTGGTGFGLGLSKTVIESCGGDIWIESEQGVGTAVYFTIPTFIND